MLFFNENIAHVSLFITFTAFINLHILFSIVHSFSLNILLKKNCPSLLMSHVLSSLNYLVSGHTIHIKLIIINHYVLPLFIKPHDSYVLK